MADQFDAASAVDGFLADQTAGQLKTSLALSSAEKPDFVAESRRLSQTLGLPPQTVAGDIEDSRRRATLETFDAAAYARDFPQAAKFMADPQNAAIAHDDTENLGALDAVLGVIKGTGKALGSAPMKFNEGAWGVARAGAELLPDFVGKPLAGVFAGYGRQQRGIADSMMPKTDNPLAAGWYSGMQSLGLNLLQLPLGVTGKMGPVLGAMGATTGGQAYGQARDQGVGVLPSLAFGASQGIIEAGTEMLGMPALFGMLKPGQFGAKALEYLVKEQGGEQIATHLQDLNEWGVLPENKNKTFADYFAERPNAALQTAIATAVGGGGQVAVMKGVQLALNRAERGQQAAQQAEQGAQAIAALDQLAAASKLRERAPDTFAQFVEQATQDGPVPDVYIDAQTLAQSGIAEQVAAVSPAVAEQLPAALATGGSVRIPVADFATNIAGTEYAQPLLDHLKTDPEGFSRAEAQEYMQSQAEQLQQEVERTLAEKQGDDTFKASAEAVKNEVKAQLDTAGRFTGQVNDAYAAMVGNFYAVMGARLGISPQDMFARYPLRVTAERIAGELQQLDQGEAPAVAQEGGAVTLPQDGAAPVSANGETLAQSTPNANFTLNKGPETNARGSFSPATNTITLLKNADLSTFLHEGGHFFLEVMTDMASREDAPQAVKDDAAALMKWFGLNGLDEWHNLDFEEKRSYHEKFARGFEAYLFEGKGPSIEMQGLFQRFRAWMLNIYRELKALNVELSDEVRGVMDRMLASTEEIQLAEKGRSMMPLFTSP